MSDGSRRTAKRTATTSATGTVMRRVLPSIESRISKRASDGCPSYSPASPASGPRMRSLRQSEFSSDTQLPLVCPNRLPYGRPSKRIGAERDELAALPVRAGSCACLPCSNEFPACIWIRRVQRAGERTTNVNRICHALSGSPADSGGVKPCPGGRARARCGEGKAGRATDILCQP